MALRDLDEGGIIDVVGRADQAMRIILQIGNPDSCCRSAIPPVLGS